MNALREHRVELHDAHVIAWHDRPKPYTLQQQARYDNARANLDGLGFSEAMVHRQAHWSAMNVERPEIWTAKVRSNDADPGLAVGLDIRDDRQRPEEAPLSRFDRAPLDWKILADGEPPARDWAIAGWFGMGHATLLAGAGGIGKSLLAQQIGSALALGVSFVGEIPRARTVLYWAAEDDHDELWRRQLAIAAHLAAPLESFAGKLLVESFVDRDCTLMDCGEFGGRLIATPMLDELREQVADYGADVVLLDNVARLFGGKEADRGHVTRFVSRIVGACHGAAVMLLAHPGRATGSEWSGSSAWEASVRTRLYLGDRPPDQTGDDEPDAPTGTRYLARRKRNYAGPDLRTLQYRDGVLIPDEPAGGNWLVDGLRSDRADRVLMSALQELVGMGLSPTEGTRSPEFLPRLILDYKLAEGMTKRELSDAMRRLMVAGRLVRTEVGKYANRTTKYGLRAA